MTNLIYAILAILALFSHAQAGSISFGGGSGLNATVVTGNAADNQLLVGFDANAVAWVTVPDCANGVTSKLLFDQATNIFSCGVDQTGAPGAGDISIVGNCTSSDCAIETGTDIFPLLQEGTANDFETTFSVVDPTADRAIAFPNNSGTVGVAGTAPVTMSAAGAVGLTQNAGTDVTADLEEEGQISASIITGNAADDQVILGSAANAAAWAALPLCSDPVANKLLYDPATNTFSCGTDQSAGGSSLVLDLADNGVDESAALGEIATSGDTNSVFTELSADKLLIDLAQDWPKADTADDLTCTNCIGSTEITDLTLGTDTSGGYAASVSEAGPATTATALAANGANCTPGEAAGGVDESGVAEDCFAPAGSGDVTRVAACQDGNCGIEGGNDLFPILHEGTANTEETTISVTEPTADHAIAFPANSGTVAVVATAPITLSATGVVALTQDAGTDITANLEEEAHATEHQHGGADEIATATPAINAILKAGGAGTIATGWLPQNAGTDITANLEEEGNINATVVTGDTIDDQVILGSGANTAAWVSLSDCDNPENSKLLYDTTTNAFSCGADQGAGGTGDISTVGNCTSSDCGIETGTDIYPLLQEGTANEFETTFSVVDPTADRTIAFPNNSGTVPVAVTAPVTLSATGVVALTQNAGTDITADLEEEAHATEHQHGGADEVATATPAANAIPKTGAGGTLANGWTTATSANTASAIVARDGSGNFTAGTITAALTGTASAATALAANGANCSAGQAAGGINTSGDAESCIDPVLDSDISPAEGFVRKTGAGTYTAHKSNLTATTDPLVTDDLSLGYSVGSVWINTAEGTVFQCTDDFDGAAVWSDLTNSTPTSLQGAFEANKEITGANSSANAVLIGNGTTKLRLFCDGSGTCQIRCDNGGAECDNRLGIPNGRVLEIYDEEGTAVMLTIDPDAASVNAMYQFGAAYRPLKSIVWNAGALVVDGANCAVPTEQTLNSGPRKWALSCADSTSSIFYGSVDAMPDGWDGGTVTFELSVFHATTETITFAGDFSCQCRGDGEVPTSTWGTAVASDVLITTANRYEQQTTAAATCAGTCAAGDILDWRYVVDATTFSTNAVNTKVVGVKMEYTVSSLSD